jgi:hypothetical protein
LALRDSKFNSVFRNLASAHRNAVSARRQGAPNPSAMRLFLRSISDGTVVAFQVGPASSGRLFDRPRTFTELKGTPTMLTTKTLIAAAVAAVFALPLAVNAAGTEKSGSSPSATSPSAGKSSSASGNGGSMSSMKKLDTNSDGSVSRDEAKKDTNISKRFKELDKNNDGKLSATELNAAEATGAGGSPGGKASSAQGSATEGKRGNGSGSGGSK